MKSALNFDRLERGENNTHTIGTFSSVPVIPLLPGILRYFLPLTLWLRGIEGDTRGEVCGLQRANFIFFFLTEVPSQANGSSCGGKGRGGGISGQNFLMDKIISSFFCVAS